MEDWIFTVFFVGYIVFSIWKEFTKGDTDTEPAPVEPTDGENEEVCMEEEGENDSSETKSKVEQILAMLGKMQTPQPESASKSVMPTPMSVKPSVPSKSASHHEAAVNHELHSAQGARKAFIYSEIFKRKYE